MSTPDVPDTLTTQKTMSEPLVISTLLVDNNTGGLVQFLSIQKDKHKGWRGDFDID